MPRPGASRRHRTGAVAGEPHAAAQEVGHGGDRRRTSGDPDAGVRRRSHRRRDRRLDGPDLYTAAGDPPVVAGRHAGQPCDPQPDRIAARKTRARRRSAEPVHRRRGWRPSRDHPRRRHLRAAVAVPLPLRPSRRRQVLAGRTLSLSRLARRLGQQVRPLWPQTGGRDPCRHQHPQHCRFRRRQMGDGRQFPAAHTGGSRRGGLAPGQGDPGRRRQRNHVAGQCRLHRASAQQFHRRAEGHPGDLGDVLRGQIRSRWPRAWSTTTSRG